MSHATAITNEGLHILTYSLHSSPFFTCHILFCLFDFLETFYIQKKIEKELCTKFQNVSSFFHSQITNLTVTNVKSVDIFFCIKAEVFFLCVRSNQIYHRNWIISLQLEIYLFDKQLIGIINTIIRLIYKYNARQTKNCVRSLQISWCLVPFWSVCSCEQNGSGSSQVLQNTVSAESTSPDRQGRIAFIQYYNYCLFN